MGCSQSKSAAAVVVESPPANKAAAAAAVPAVIQKQEEQSLIQQAATTATPPEVVEVLPKEEQEGPNNNNETTASMDALEKENNVASSCAANKKENEATNDATTTTTPVATTSEAAKANQSVQNEEATAATTTTTLPGHVEKDENVGSSTSSVPALDDGKVAGDARPITGEISSVDEVVSSVTAADAAQEEEESTVPVVAAAVEEEKVVAAAAAAAAVAAVAVVETGSATTEALKENNVEETTPQEQGVAVAASVLPVVITGDVVEVQTEKVSCSEQNEKVLTDMAGVGSSKEEEEVEAQPSPESGAAATSNVVIREKNETSPTDTVVEATQTRPEPDTTPLVDHVAASSIVTKDDESCEAVITTTESVNVVKEKEVLATSTPVLETVKALEEITPEIVSKQESLSPTVTVEEKLESVITESVEVKEEEMNIPIVEANTPVAPDVAGANKIIEAEQDLQLHSEQQTSTVNGEENMGGPLCEKEQVTEPIVGSVESPASSAVTETDDSKPTGEGETSAVITEDKPEHISSDCSGHQEEVPMPVEHENPDVPTTINATETASTVGKLEASNVQVVDSSEPSVGVEKEELTSAQPEQTAVASTQTTSNDIEIEEPALTNGVTEVPVEKVDHLVENDRKLMGSEIEHPETGTSESPEECPKESAPVDVKTAGGLNELNTSSIEEQAACQPTCKEGVVVDVKILSCMDQADAATTDAAPMMAAETSNIATNEKMETGKDIKKPEVAEDLEHSESRVSHTDSQEQASSSSADEEEATETSPEEEQEEEEPEDDEPIVELKNVTAMSRVLIPEDQRVQSAAPPVASRWGWSTGLGMSSGTSNMTGIGSDSAASEAPKKAVDEKAKMAWGLQTVGLLSFTRSTSSEAEENGQAKSDVLTNDAEVSKPMETKDEPLSDTKEPESSSSSSTAAAPVGSTAATSTLMEQPKKSENPPPKKKPLTDIEKARLFAASVLLESEHVVVKEEKATPPKRFGSWF